jgi:hypothetical protein
MQSCSGGCSSSSIAVKLVLGVDAPDAGVDVGSLIWSIQRGGIHSGSPSSLMRQLPAFLQKMGVVVSAEQGQVVKIGRTAEDPIQDVVSVAPGCWVGAAGEAAAGVSGDQISASSAMLSSC